MAGHTLISEFSRSAVYVMTTFLNSSTLHAKENIKSSIVWSWTAF